MRNLFSFTALVWLLLSAPGIALAGVNSGLFASYQQLLDSHLNEVQSPSEGFYSAFDYDGALADSTTAGLLEQQNRALAAFAPDSLGGREESVAFWINAYNYFMIAQILTDRPDGRLVDSVWDYGGRFNPFVDSVFDVSRFVVGGRRYSLSEIEKEILLGDDYRARGWKDARVHFAVNCASVGCPPLRKQVYTADNLETMLAENTRLALASSRHLRVDGDVLYGTELFKWYEQDFAEAEGSVAGFIQRWADPEVARVAARTSEIKFIDYDWSLNRPENFRPGRGSAPQ